MNYGVPEIFATETKSQLKSLYMDIQYVLKVPIVNFIFRTLAHYEQFLAIGWRQVRPNMLTVNMEREAEGLRYPSISFKAEKVNWEHYYSKESFKEIKGIISTFNYVNPKLLIIATAWEEALGHRPIIGGKIVQGYIQPGVSPGFPKIKLINIPNSPPHIYKILKDIINTHHAYDSASDYRALAYYPDFLDIAWSATKKFVGSDEYVLVTKKLKEQALKIVHQKMPFPVSMTPEFFQRYYGPQDIAGIMGLVSMFKELIVSLIIDLECFRRFTLHY